MRSALQPMPPERVRLLPGLFHDRFERNRRYLKSLDSHNLLQNFYLEARLWQATFRRTWHDPARIGEPPDTGDDRHWGWESPTCQIRGHFLGHWLSAAVRVARSVDDAELLARANAVVAELGRCQRANGGEWVGPIPESYLHWTAKGQPTWAPQYVLHKTLMGLLDAARLAGNDQALDILERAARWFHRWSGQFSRDEFDEILDVETGGMLELWADLYGLTGKQEHLDLLRRYDRPRLFEPLLAGEDVLTNRHANTTIPEAHGAARAYEVTREQRWRDIAEAYWKCAVTDRGFFCTGGQTAGEIWTPPFAMSARLGDTNQEHCVVYNMIRLADYLFRWTGDVVYADYIERNLFNGILAQQNPRTGMVSYFLPLRAGARKIWGSPTNDFWCCHGTLVQAHSLHGALGYYEEEGELAVAQYIPSELRWGRDAGEVQVRLEDAHGAVSIGKPGTGAGPAHRPAACDFEIAVDSHSPRRFALRLRIPWWVNGRARIAVNDEAPLEVSAAEGWARIERNWERDRVRIELPRGLSACPLPGEPGTVAFLDGPVVLAGLVGEERTIEADPDDPCAVLVPDNEREWGNWLGGYRIRGQDRGLRFVPVHEVIDAPYTVYFPIRRPAEHRERSSHPK